LGDVVADHVSAIRSTGLRITGPVDTFTIRGKALTRDEVSRRGSRIFLAVKAHHTEEAAQILAPHLAPDGYVLSLQNGLCESIIERVVGRARTMGAFVNFGADWIAPGEILYGNR